MIMASAAPLSDSKGKKTSGCGGGGGTGASAGLRPPEQGLKCPRCDSPSTKFCYYNNYSLTQPRHFCKSCRRYWTKGGALRNVPVGGGCRKNKKSKSSTSSASCSPSPSTSSHLILDAIAAIPDPTAAGLKLLNQTAMDFHLGYLPFSSGNQLMNSFGCFSSPAGATSTSMGAGFSYNNPIGAACSSNGSNSNYSSIASSIESLSSINQDLHWRLQQQRMAMLYGSEAHKESLLSVTEQSQVVEPMNAFGVTESNKGEIFGDNTAAAGPCSSRKSSHDAAGTAWFLDGSFAMPASGSMNNTDANLNIGSNAASDWNGITAWGDVHNFSTSLP